MRLGKRRRAKLKRALAVRDARCARNIRTGEAVNVRLSTDIVLPVGKRRGRDWLMLQKPRGGHW